MPKLETYMYSDINPNRWSSETKAKRKAWKCEHRHSGFVHAACYNKEFNIQERIGCLDIEAGGLDADFDICLSWANKQSGQSNVTYDHLIPADLTKGRYDSRIIETLIDELWKYDRIITHYGSNFRFDIPFIRSRYLWLKARKMYSGKPFPSYGQMWLSDTYTMARKLLKIASRRQDSVANTIVGKDVKTKIAKDHWMAIKYGNAEARQKAIDYIVEHNLKDVEQLDDNYLALNDFVRSVRSSI